MTKSNSKSKVTAKPPVALADKVIPIHTLTEADIYKILGEDAKCVQISIEPEKVADIAQDLAYEAMDISQKRKRVALAKKALRLDDNCSDAWWLLARETNKLDESIDLCRKALVAAENTLGPGFVKKYKPHFYGCIETRPYMRARAELAMFLEDDGQLEEAIDHYKALLELNPDDNQGIRDLIVPCLFTLSRDGEVDKILKKYKERTAWHTYSRALLSFRSSTGNIAKLHNAFADAIASNPFVPAFLLGAMQLPRKDPEFYTYGDETEAVIYARHNMDVWEVTPGALDLLEDEFISFLAIASIDMK